MSYQVGDLIDFKDNDPVFDDATIAINEALAKSREFEEEYFGVWDMDNDGHLIAIAHQGWLYNE